MKKKDSYVIEKVAERKNGVVITIKGHDYLLSLNQYSDHYYYPDKELSKEEYLLLKKDAKNKKASDYLSLLVSSRRYTYQELYNKLKTKYTLTHKEIQGLLLPYVESGIIDDRTYALDYIDSKIELGYGKNYLLQHLREKGISKEILESQEIQSLFENEDEYLLPLIKKVDQSKKGSKTLTQRKQLLYPYLLRRGYSSTKAGKAIESYFSSLSSQEKENQKEEEKKLLEKEMQNAYRQINNRTTMDAKKKKDTLIRKLLSKGFAYQEIKEEFHRKEYTFDD